MIRKRIFAQLPQICLLFVSILILLILADCAARPSTNKATKHLVLHIRSTSLNVTYRYLDILQQPQLRLSYHMAQITIHRE